MSVTRREFLSVGGGAVVFLAGWSSPAAADCAVIGDQRLVTPWIAITQASRVVVLVDKCEMGQGVRDLFARIVADELGVAPEDMLVEDAPVGRPYRNAKFPIPVLRFQITGYSSSTADAWEKLRAAASQTAQALREGAADKLGVSPAQVVLHDGWVVANDKSKRPVTYAEAVGWTPTAATPPPREGRRPARVGDGTKRGPRIDTRDKITGCARYGIDVDATELGQKPLVALVLRPGRADHPLGFGVDPILAMRLDGVKHVCTVRDGRGIAIVADSFWRAYRARADALERLAPPAAAPPSVWASSEQTMTAYHSEASVGLRDDRREGHSFVVDRVYETPYAPHAPLEPMTAACRKKGRVYDIWAATQFPEGARARVADALRISPDSVVIHGMLAGGSFGRRVASDFIVEVAEICKAIGGRAVKLIWTRDEDFRHDYLRPCAVNRVTAQLTGGRITEWTQHVGVRSASLPLARDFTLSTPFGPVVTRAVGLLPAVGRTIQHSDSLDPTASEGISDSKYDIKPSIRILKGPAPTETWRPRVGYWRSVNFFHTIFAVESTIDDLAAAGSLSPVKLRRNMLDACARLASCLTWVAEHVGEEKFQRPARGDIGHGLACFSGFDSFAALAVEIRIDEVHGRPQIRVRKAVAAVDCGKALYPDVVKQQVEGGIIFGLSAALKQDVTIVDGVVQQQNFDQCDILRMHECPEIVVECLDGGPKATPTGVGELMVPLVAPAVANAVFNLTGKRLLRLPLTLPGRPA